jgi:putative flippase GtrA
MKIHKQMYNFIIIGGISSLLDYIVYIILFFFGMNYLSASLIGNIAGAFNNFILNRKITFNNISKNYFIQIIKYLFVFISFLCFSYILLFIISVYIISNIYLSKIITMMIMTIYNFSINKYYVFNDEI